MEIDLMKLDFLVVKQAIRDVASKDEKLSNQALSYFISDDFKSLCFRNKINLETVHKKYKRIKSIPFTITQEVSQ